MKISPVKNNVAPKVLVDKSIQEPYLGYLNQASGVIENYLKYEKDVGQIFIKNGDFWGNNTDKILTVSRKTPRFQTYIQILKESDIPFLRLVYQAVQISVEYMK